ncbi:MAG: ATP-binding cassette domain-containing protein, partial [Pseudomonadota bacterium]
FRLQPGDGLGVIGPSASGKTTLARLLVGGWQPEAGTVRLDGATLDKWATSGLGRHIGYLPQALELLPGSVKDNIARFSADAQDDQVIAAAKLAGVHDMILALPEGYETQCGPGAHALSGGQVQRIGLARALYGDPALVVLDEPNAHLDAVGDEALTRAILHLRQAGRTVVVMAHRPSAIAAVNKVLVLQEGRVVQFGDKTEVLKSVTTKPRVAEPAA